MPEDPSEGRRLKRRRALQLMGSGFGSVLASTPAIAGDSQQGWAPGNDDWLGNLLPADRTGVLDPRVSKDVSTPEKMHVDVSERYAQAAEQGFLQIGTAGDLGGGQGDLAVDGAAWVESLWQPTDPGQHRVTVTYEHSAEQFRRTLQTGADLVLTSEANLAVIDDTDTVVAQQSALGQNEVTAETQEFVIEELLTRVATYILFPGLGVIGRFLGDFLVGAVVDHLVEIEPNSSGPLVQTPLSLTFDADPSSTYRIRFTANNGFSGRTWDANDHFMAESSAFFELTDFSIEPTGFRTGGSDDGVTWPP